MSFFDHQPVYYEGKELNLYIHSDCYKELKKTGVFLKVLARLKKICDTKNFGKPKEGYKFFEKENLGWLKWPDGTRVYYSLFEDGKIMVTLKSGSKNKQDKDIKKAKEYLNEIKKEEK